MTEIYLRFECAHYLRQPDALSQESGTGELAVQIRDLQAVFDACAYCLSGSLSSNMIASASVCLSAWLSVWLDIVATQHTIPMSHNLATEPCLNCAVLPREVSHVYSAA